MKAESRELHEAAWPDMFRSLQEAYAELSRAEHELEQRTSEIRDARNLFAQLVEAMSEALFFLDVSGRVRRANPAAARLLEMDRPEELTGEQFADISGNPDLPSTPWEIEERRREEGDVGGFAAEVRTRTGTTLPVLVSCSTVRNDEGAVEGVLVVIRDISDLKATEERLRESLREKKLLLRELHHRVKGNFQTIMSLLRLQLRTVEDEQARRSLEECQNRIAAVATLHQRLYETDGPDRVELSGYLKNLARDVVRTHGASSRHRLRLDLEEIEVSIDDAVPLGLLVHELITNALRHAYAGEESGEIRVRLHRANGRVTLAVADDGRGLEQAPGESTDGIGMSLVRSFTESLQADLTIQTDGGTRVELMLPETLLEDAASGTRAEGSTG